MFYVCYKRFRILSCLLFLFVLYGLLWFGVC
ncbi:hypothetical protein FBUS_06574 [Fasciolopsis buskii]|uniref:Uncharacterized protein n=1 Tax=Fasciolopsis buskii TaxID=27845 RepID=A0A8E0RZD6_9TREM|nr:hypothetical protein FBUS_06574 [Fasciolopsis buski]